ncbi:MAG: hypothetical protein ACQEQY_06260 [Halobacteriota archaeon]
MNTKTLRHAVAALGAVVVAGVVLFALDAAAPGLTTGVWMRDTLATVAGQPAQYEAYTGTWLLARGIVGLYVTGVVAGVTVLLLLGLRRSDTEATA